MSDKYTTFSYEVPNGQTIYVTIDTDTNTTSSVVQKGPGNQTTSLDPVTLLPLT
jgi:hypothetical protein